MASASSAHARTALVHFRADEPGAVLESDATATGSASSYYVVCHAPCDELVYADGSFRVGGASFHPSRPFRLPLGRNEVMLKAEMVSSSVAVPMALAIVGGGIGSVGLMLLAGGILEERDHRDGETLIVSGAVVAGVGGAMGAVGVIMLLVKAQDRESTVRVANGAALELPAGLSLDARGFVF